MKEREGANGKLRNEKGNESNRKDNWKLIRLYFEPLYATEFENR